MKLNGSLLKDARDRKGLTQQELARAAGISVPTIVRAERGGEVWPGTGRHLCDFLEIDLALVVISRSQEGDGDAA